MFLLDFSSSYFIFFFYRLGFQPNVRYTLATIVYLWTDKKRIILRGRAAAYYVINYRSTIEVGN